MDVGVNVRQNFSLHHQYHTKQTSDGNERKYQLGEYMRKKLTQYQIKLSPYRLYHSGRHAVTRVAHEILRMKGLDLIIYLINGRTI